MGLGRELVGLGATEYKQLDPSGALRTMGEGDSVLKPISKRRSGKDFPTLVVEAGHTQIWPSLRTKARWWFEHSKRDVKVVLLTKADMASTQIKIEKWKAVETMPTWEGRVTTQSETTFEPVCLTTIEITRRAGIGNNDSRRFAPTSYGVTGGPLRLEFEDLFLRRPAQGEHDIVLGTADLQDYAVLVWKAFS